MVPFSSISNRNALPILGIWILEDPKALPLYSYSPLSWLFSKIRSRELLSRIQTLPLLEKMPTPSSKALWGVKGLQQKKSSRNKQNKAKEFQQIITRTWRKWDSDRKCISIVNPGPWNSMFYCSFCVRLLGTYQMSGSLNSCLIFFPFQDGFCNAEQMEQKYKNTHICLITIIIQLKLRNI